MCVWRGEGEGGEGSYRVLLFGIFCKKFFHQHAVIKSTISIPSYFYFLDFANGIRLVGNDNTCIIHDNTGIGPPRNRQR